MSSKYLSTRDEHCFPTSPGNILQKVSRFSFTSACRKKIQHKISLSTSTTHPTHTYHIYPALIHNHTPTPHSSHITLPHPRVWMGGGGGTSSRIICLLPQQLVFHNQLPHKQTQWNFACQVTTIKIKTFIIAPLTPPLPHPHPFKHACVHTLVVLLSRKAFMFATTILHTAHRSVLGML